MDASGYFPESMRASTLASDSGTGWIGWGGAMSGALPEAASALEGPGKEPNALALGERRKYSSENARTAPRASVANAMGRPMRRKGTTARDSPSGTGDRASTTAIAPGDAAAVGAVEVRGGTRESTRRVRRSRQRSGAVESSMVSKAVDMAPAPKLTARVAS